MPQNNPKQEAELDNDSVLMHKIDEILYGEHPQPYSRGDAILMLIRNQINAHTTKLLNEQLDRLEKKAVYGHLAVPNNTQFIPLTAIENERKKLR